LSGARHILHLLSDYGNGASKQIIFSLSIKKVPISSFSAMGVKMSQCSIFTVPGDNSNRLKDKKKPRTTVKKF
jgi:hypothetical protein